jgi:hypothetical protein
MPIIPTIHSNGTDAATLLDQARVAYSTGREFKDALIAMMPHGRDYYVQGNEIYAQAREEHIKRIAEVDRIINEITEIAFGINEQLKE